MSICANTMSPKRAAIDDLLQHAHRLVVAHVLVDREDLAGLLRLVAQLDRLLERQRQRLLRQDRLDVLLLQRVADQRRLLVRRKGEIDDLDRLVLDQRFRRRRGPSGCPSASRPSAALALVREAIATTGKARLLVGGKMALGHDHAGADAADLVALRADLHVRLELMALAITSSPTCLLVTPIIAAARLRPCEKRCTRRRVAGQRHHRFRPDVRLAAHQRPQPRPAGIHASPPCSRRAARPRTPWPAFRRSSPTMAPP